MTEYEKLQIEWLKQISDKLGVISILLGFGIAFYVSKELGLF